MLSRHLPGRSRGTYESPSKNNVRTSYNIQSSSGHYLCVKPDSTVVCEGTKAGGWETLYIKYNDDNNNNDENHKSNTASIQNCHGKYISIQENGSIEWDRDSVGLWEQMDLLLSASTAHDGGRGVGLALRSCHTGTYLSAPPPDTIDDPTMAVHCNSNKIGKHELFYGMIPIVLRSHHNNYMCADKNGKVTWNRPNVGAWETFLVHVKSSGSNNNKVTFQNIEHGTYLSAQPNYGGLVCNRPKPGAWETFEIVPATGGSGDGSTNFAIKTDHGKFICVQPNGSIAANRDTIGPWETFTSGSGSIVDSSATNGKLSHVGRAAYNMLRQKHSQYHHKQWNVTEGRVIGELHQTPRVAFVTEESIPRGEDIIHDDWFPNIMCDMMKRTKTWCDVTSLGPPDGIFMEKFQEALQYLASTADERDYDIIIRMMFGNIVGMPVNCNALINKFTECLNPDPGSSKLKLWVGAWRKGVSWNHAKIIAIDGQYLHTGGHNLWDHHYLRYDPVHDLSLELQGNVAHDGHLFANDQWAYIRKKQETVVGTVIDWMPDSIPLAKRSRVTVSEWPRGVATEHPPLYERSIVPHDTSNSSFEIEVEEVDTQVPVITLGRYGEIIKNGDRPSDDAFLAMFHSSQKIIRMALQDLGPVCFPSTKIPLPGCVWPIPYLSALGRAMYERGVDVEIALSNPGSIPGGLSPTEACYGNGWSCIDVASEIIKTIKTQYPDADDGHLRQVVRDNLRVCFIREPNLGKHWEDGMTMGMHSKHFIIDDIATYIGSQNLYVCDLAEWGVVIDNAEQTSKFMEQYWNPLWENSYANGFDCNVDDVMDGLSIDRNGEDLDGISEETEQLMLKAQQAHSGCGANSDMYGSEK